MITAASRSSDRSLDWTERNRRYLQAALQPLRVVLQRYSEDASAAGTGTSREPIAAAPAAPLLIETDPEAAFPALCRRLGLSRFERCLLLLCAGVELDSRLARLCADIHGDPASGHVSFGLCLAVLPEAHFSALSPDSPLRRFQILRIEPDGGLSQAPLRIEERVLYHLLGLAFVDEWLAALLLPLPSGAMPPAQPQLAPRLHAFLEQHTQGEVSATRAVIYLCGDDERGQLALVAAAADRLGLPAYKLYATQIPADAEKRVQLCRLWARELLLRPCLLVIIGNDAAGASAEPLRELGERLPGLLVLIRREAASLERQPALRLTLSRPLPPEQQMLWQQSLDRPGKGLEGMLERLSNTFHLSSAAIAAASAEVKEQLACLPPEEIEEQLWQACRIQARLHLDELAERLTPTTGWDDLVVPPAQLTTLHEIAAHLRQRSRVHYGWGLSSRSSRGLGISALFAGPSGTGKTMAAEVIAREIKLDLYRIDLSQVISKYIGETEKNLRRIFDAAETGGAILLFDEADALFGKRSEVKDSHDRYANIEVSYLLQRMESYRGLAILTTNFKEALDSAFLRRLRFVVDFPFPDSAQRAEIWRRIFPAAMPLGEIDFPRLSQLSITGGNIHNIMVNAAFLAADASESVGMSHLLAAARREYEKLDKPLIELEVQQ